MQSQAIKKAITEAKRTTLFAFVVASGAVLVLFASLIPGPWASAAQVQPDAPLLQTAELKPATLETLTRSCADCHSGQTLWPLYSKVAPVSWLIRKDVSDGRRFLNFSQWTAYGAAGQRQLLEAAAAQIRLGAMPPSRYVLLHPDAALSSSSRAALLDALDQESRRLSKLTP